MDGVDCDGVSANVGVAADRRKLIDFTIDRYQKMDILVSNGAVNPHFGNLMEVSDSQWDKLLNVNVSFKHLNWQILFFTF